MRPKYHRRIHGPKPKEWDKPPLTLQTTTLWEYPSQHYGNAQQGSQSYVGATPSYIIWNLIERYVPPTGLVVDPFCGSGTTLDVARDLGRQAKGFDLAPHHPHVERGDARNLPLANGVADLVFMDPPYGDHITYSGLPECIGTLSAFSDDYFSAMEQAIKEAVRICKPGGVVAIYVCDFFKKGQGFVPTGARLAGITEHYAPLIEMIAVVRHNKALAQGSHHQAAERDNFFLRGFNHLIVAQKA